MGLMEVDRRLSYIPQAVGRMGGPIATDQIRILQRPAGVVPNAACARVRIHATGTSATDKTNRRTMIDECNIVELRKTRYQANGIIAAPTMAASSSGKFRKGWLRTAKYDNSKSSSVGGITMTAPIR